VVLRPRPAQSGDFDTYAGHLRPKPAMLALRLARAHSRREPPKPLGHGLVTVSETLDTRRDPVLSSRLPLASVNVHVSNSAVILKRFMGTAGMLRSPVLAQRLSWRVGHPYRATWQTWRDLRYAQGI